MTEKKYEKLIHTDMNRDKDEIGTRLFTLDSDLIGNIPFFTDFSSSLEFSKLYHVFP